MNEIEPMLGWRVPWSLALGRDDVDPGDPGPQAVKVFFVVAVTASCDSCNKHAAHTTRCQVKLQREK
ncbi:hypothetical protein [Arthrobacter sp. Marseille-P9274]|uniref:hypothetical protein n=1 Tax=Arthrobacter sp. Marseille-P9274 TaxID=2866572 RepID=UPI0021C9EDF1|nr:hypothetical protein [Arthrobacter sp. Marseille-P9274]